MFEIGPNGFPMPKNLGIDTKIKSLACSERKLQIRPDMCTVLQKQPNSQIQTKWPQMTHKGPKMSKHVPLACLSKSKSY